MTSEVGIPIIFRLAFWRENWFWSFTILRMAYRLMTQSEIGEDDRSDNDEESTEGEESKKDQ